MFGLLRRVPGYRLLIGVLVLVGIGAIAMFALRKRGVGYDIDPAERYVVERATEDAAQALARGLPVRKVLLMPLAGKDKSEDNRFAMFVNEELRDRLEEVGDFEVLAPRDVGIVEAIVEKVKALIAARKAPAPAVIYGEVAERSTSGGRTRVTVALRAVKADDGGTLLARAFEGRLRRSWASGAYRRVWIRSRSGWGRMLVWVAVAALLPLMTAGVAKPLLARESNPVNVALLGTYTLLDVLAAWLLLGLAGGGAVVILIALGAIAAGVYNYVICDRLALAAT